MLKKLRQPVGNYQAPIFWSVMMGSLLCVGYYSLLRFGPVSLPLLERYSKCHAVAYATVELFFISLCALVYKLLESSKQHRLMGLSISAIDEIKIARNEEIIEEPSQQTSWLQSAWKTQSTLVFQSWFGQRIREVVASQIRRQTIEQLDEDLRVASERDADQQHDSYALVRILTWAMPMLGFLGTVLGISETLGQMDASALASGSQDAMNGLTAGLYVAFDTTAIGLILTMAVMFFQFAVNKSEIKLLTAIDNHTSDLIRSCILQRKELPDLANVRQSLQIVGEGILQSMEQLVQKQAELWQQSMETAESRWTSMQHSSALHLSEALSAALSKVMEATQSSLLEHHETIARLHSREAESLDARISEWQRTISEQSRAMLEQQRENSAQTELLHQLIDQADLVKSMEGPLQSTLHKLTNVDRFHDAAVCLTEAVAVLGTQMERYGYLGRQPVRRRANSVVGPDTPANQTGDADAPQIIPFTRKAG